MMQELERFGDRSVRFSITRIVEYETTELDARRCHADFRDGDRPITCFDDQPAGKIALATMPVEFDQDVLAGNSGRDPFAEPLAHRRIMAGEADGEAVIAPVPTSPVPCVVNIVNGGVEWAGFDPVRSEAKLVGLDDIDRIVISERFGQNLQLIALILQPNDRSQQSHILPLFCFR